VILTVRCIRPAGRIRAGIRFSHAADVYEVTEEQEAAIRGDHLLVVIEDKPAPAPAPVVAPVADPTPSPKAKR